MRLPLRGEVWAVYLNPARGHEQAGWRLCLVISDDIYNQGPAAKHIVLPVTSRHKGIPYHLTVKPPEGGLQLASYIMCDKREPGDVAWLLTFSALSGVRRCSEKVMRGMVAGISQAHDSLHRDGFLNSPLIDIER